MSGYGITPTKIMEEIISERLKRRPGDVQRLNAVILFDLSGPDGGQWTLDCTKDNGLINKGRTAMPHVTLSMSDDTFVKIHTREISPHFAGMTGRVKFKPMDFGIAQKLLPLLR